MSNLVVTLRAQRPLPLNGTLTCPAGKVVALLGPSGAGKTTWLHVVAGLVRPDEGTVRLGSTIWFDSQADRFVPPQTRGVGLVFQHYALMPHLTVLNNVALALWRQPRQNRQQQAEQWLERVGLPAPLWHRLPAELSGGERQRVAMARALASNPRVLLLDEPFSAVDAMHRQALYAILAELRAEVTIPIVLVTHDLTEARLLADEIAVIDQGTLLQQGPTEALYLSPRNGRVAAILGIRNRFHGRWLGADPDHPGWGRLLWLPTPSATDETAIAVLPARDKGRIPPGQLVDWVIQNDALTLVPEHSCGDISPPTQMVLAVQVVVVRSSGEFSLIVVSELAHPQVAIELVATGSERRSWVAGSRAHLVIDTRWIHVMPVRRHHP